VLQEFDAIWEVLLTPEKERVLRLLIANVTYDAGTERLSIVLSLSGIVTLSTETAGHEPIGGYDAEEERPGQSTA
jgi:hypothetical protein